MYCPNCGAEVKQGDKFCSSCGKPLKVNENIHQYQRHEDPERNEGHFVWHDAQDLSDEKIKNSDTVFVLKEQGTKSTASLVSSIIGAVLLLAFIGAAIELRRDWKTYIVASQLWIGILIQIIAIILNILGYIKNNKSLTITSIGFYILVLFPIVNASKSTFLVNVDNETMLCLLNIVPVILQAVAASKMPKIDIG